MEALGQILGGLVTVLVGWIADLITAGNSPDEAAAIIRRDIEDRRAEIAANRAEVDEALDEKWREKRARQRRIREGVASPDDLAREANDGLFSTGPDAADPEGDTEPPG